MFKNHKFEIRFVKDKKSPEASASPDPLPEYISMAEKSIERLGRQALVGVAAIVGTITLATIVVHASTNALDNIQIPE